VSERVDIIDETGQVIRTCPRVDAKGYLTRWIQIFLFDEKGNWILQQRAREKSFRPNLIECAVGGQVHAGETFDEAAKRELVEELNFEVKLDFAFESWGTYGLCHVFFGTYAGELPEPNKEEVERLFKLNEDEINFLMEKTPFVVMRGFRDSYAVYQQNKNKG
jgi:isopentenyl-diphosphate delta-isomerase